MLTLAGLCVVMVAVFGGYVLAGGHLSIILAALPFELLIIGGAGVGIFVMANSTAVLKRAAGDVMQTLKGPRWRKEDYTALLCLLFELVRLARTDAIGLESHIEDPATSEIFGRYPQIRADGFAVALICDYLRAFSMSFDDPHQVSEIMESDLELHQAEALRPAQALQTLTDALPALGIVAAVLGVIKTMASIDQPPAVLGKMIGGALVGTFLGVFLAYGFVGPLASTLKSTFEAETKYYQCMKAALLAYVQGYAPAVAVEFARKALFTDVRPTFYEVEESVSALPAAQA